MKTFEDDFQLVFGEEGQTLSPALRDLLRSLWQKGVREGREREKERQSLCAPHLEFHPDKLS